MRLNLLRRIPWLTTGLAVLVVILGVNMYAPGVVAHPPGAASAELAPLSEVVPVQVASDSETFTQIYNSVSPSVVAISVTLGSEGRVVGSATGSGFVIDKQGYVLTNDHVVDGASTIEVEFFDGTLAWATVVGADSDADLAVLKVNVPQETLYPVTFRDSNTLQIGETVLAIGSPFGENWTLTSGIISGLDRTIQSLGQFSIGGVIQTDAAINPGNSGGPLLDLQGQVIGVNSQIATTSNSNSGVGFAIPSSLAQRVAQDLIANGKTQYSYIGIAGGDLTLTLIDALGLPEDTRGVIVSDVTPGGPASQAGLQAASADAQGVPSGGDIITAINGYALKGMDDLVSYLARETAPGQSVQLTVLRNGSQDIQVSVQLAPRPATAS